MSPSRKPLDIARRCAAQRPYRFALFAVFALFANWKALGQVGSLNDFRDSHLLHSYEVAAVDTVRDYGQAPLWNPWACGGMYASGNPQTRFASPTFLVSLAFGARRGEGILAFVFLFLGLEGAFQFLRERTGSALAATLAAPAFALNGFFAVSWKLGWAYFYGFELLPWILLGIGWTVRGRRAGLPLTVAGFAIMIGFGGTYAVPLTGLFALIESARGLYRLRGPAARKRALLRLLAAGLLTVAACAFRLWPILETMHTSPRVMAGAPHNSLESLASQLFGLPHEDAGDFFIGYGIALIACTACLSRRALFPAIVVVVSGWLAIGYTSPSLFALLREVPIFNLLRYPERLLVPGSLYIAQLAAHGMQAVLMRSRKRAGWRALAAPLALLALGNALFQAYESNRAVRDVTLVAPTDPVEQPFAQARGNRWSSVHFLELNRGSISCGEGYPVRMSRALRGDRAAEEFVEDAHAGSARRIAWSPNRIELEVKASEPTHLIVNQNWHPAWIASAGEVVSRDGLLAVKLAPGTHRVVLRFLPRSAIGGGAVSSLALALAFWLARRKQWERAPAELRSVAAAVMPLALWALVPWVWHEQVPEPILTNADGSPLLVQQAPPEAQVINATFELPIRLEAARTLPADADGFVNVELYWRIEGPLPRSLGIFVHLQGPGGQSKHSDHEVIGGTYFLKQAPKHALLRDAFSVHIDRQKESGEWTLRAGLWHASGDGSRVAAFVRPGQRAREDRLELVRFTVPAP